MERKFLRAVRWIGLGVANLAALIVIVGGITAYFQFSSTANKEVVIPQVVFSNYEESANQKPKEDSSTQEVDQHLSEQKENDELFNKEFDTHLKKIHSNFNAYAGKTGEVTASYDRLKEYGADT